MATDATTPSPRVDVAEVLAREVEALGLTADERPTALCLSGGGIRSATFNLGVLQGLAKRGLLREFHYLSTVSGGGYIGAWLSALIHRAQGKVGEVEAFLAERARQRGDAADPIEHLRRHTKYLSPRLGLFAPDTWSLVSTYTRNLLLNWLVILPLLAAVLMVPRLFVAAEQWFAERGAEALLGATWRFWFGTVGLLAIAWSFGYAVWKQPSARVVPTEPDPDGARGRAAQRHFLLWCLAPLITGTALVALAWTWASAGAGAAPDAALLRQAAGAGLTLGAVGGGLGWWRRGSDLRGCLELAFAGISGAVAGAALWVFAAGFWQLGMWLPEPQRAAWWHLLYVTLCVPCLLMALSAGGTLYLGLCSRQAWATDADREWWARYGGWILITSLLWLLAAVVVVFLPASLQWLAAAMPKLATGVATSGGLAGIATAVLGFSGDTPGAAEGPAAHSRAPWKTAVLKLVGPLFLLLLLSALVLGTDLLLGELAPVSAGAHAQALLDTPWFTPLVLLALAAAAVLAAGVIHLNRFTLHAIYRDRLIRAYLGASNRDRRPHPFTGFDPNDNLWLHAMQPELRDLCNPASPRCSLNALAKPKNAAAQKLRAALSKPTRAAIDRAATAPLSRQVVDDAVTELAQNGLFREETLRTAIGEGAREPAQPRGGRGRDAAAGPVPVRLLHVVNMALNMVRTDNNAWQERKADSFTATMFHTGSARLGYRESARYAGKDGLTLGTAMTISGAAVSPNMGYQSQPLLAFLLTLLNVRLGAWFGNPGKHGERTYEREAPRLGLLTLLWEAFGRTTDTRGYVYLSDGGHFENLGLYEMVRRRCGCIVVSDAAQDADCQFADLGNAIRKVRIDLGVPITLHDVCIRKRGGQGAGRVTHYAVGEIDYGAVDPGARPGLLIYLKASLTGDEPIDVVDYANRVAAFPHESTANQFFTEAQFESYRALGEHVVDSLPPSEGGLAAWAASLTPPPRGAALANGATVAKG